MAEVFIEFAEPVGTTDGTTYMAQACGSENADGMWEGWIEFIPVASGDPIRSGRETTQPNRQDAEYWASGLTAVFLEGALNRALKPRRRPAARVAAAPIFESPAPPIRSAPANESILDPFSVYRKGQALLRQQLSAMSGWHLVNIITAYELSAADPALLQAQEPADLVELIIAAVREGSRQAK
ncbi:MAG: hypothetical protein ABIQ52_15445 [Vicinamibacterales bacterium]